MTSILTCLLNCIMTCILAHSLTVSINSNDYISDKMTEEYLYHNTDSAGVRARFCLHSKVMEMLPMVTEFNLTTSDTSRGREAV